MVITIETFPPAINDIERQVSHSKSLSGLAFSFSAESSVLVENPKSLDLTLFGVASYTAQSLLAMAR